MAKSNKTPIINKKAKRVRSDRGATDHLDIRAFIEKEVKEK